MKILKKLSHHKGEILLGISLLAATVLLHWGHVLIFHDKHHMLIYLVGDIAFLPLEVFMVSLVLHRLLESREKSRRLKKMNMVIGVFFQEVGTDLISLLHRIDGTGENLSASLNFGGTWNKKDFAGARKAVATHKTEFNLTGESLEEMKGLLLGKRERLLGLLQNPNLLEHEEFTDLLWAVSHLTDEFHHRDDFNGLPVNDLSHLDLDIRRAYGSLLEQWILYLEHLKEDYPFLFSLASRTNPLSPETKVVLV